MRRLPWFRKHIAWVGKEMKCSWWGKRRPYCGWKKMGMLWLRLTLRDRVLVDIAKANTSIFHLRGTVSIWTFHTLLAFSHTAPSICHSPLLLILKPFSLLILHFAGEEGLLSICIHYGTVAVYASAMCKFLQWAQVQIISNNTWLVVCEELNIYVRVYSVCACYAYYQCVCERREGWSPRKHVISL